MNGQSGESSMGKWAAASGAGALVFVLANAWVKQVQDATADAQTDAQIAIQQASQHGINFDTMRNDQAKAYLQLQEQMEQLKEDLADLQASRNLGPRYTLERGRQIELRVKRLEDILLSEPD